MTNVSATTEAGTKGEQQDYAELAKNVFNAVENGDIALLKEFLAPEATVWHNYDEVYQTVEQTLAGMAAILSKASMVRYRRRRCTPFDGGFLHEHVFTLTLIEGGELRIPASLIATVHDNRITQIREYMDPVGLNKLLASA
jgi:ketosteroid isomerase-like protein